VDRQLIKSYDNFDLVGVYCNNTLLYKETIPKPLPTDAQNYQLIQQFEKAIVVTDEEKNDGKSGRNYKASRDGAIRLSQERRRHVEYALLDQTKSKIGICREYKMSMRTLEKIIAEMNERAKRNQKQSKYNVDGTGLSLRQYCAKHKLNYNTIIHRMNTGKETLSLIPHEIITREKDEEWA
jgi:hypothetical protein